MRCNRKKLGEILGYDVKTISAMVERGMPYLRKPGERSSRSWLFDTAKVIDWLTGNDLKDQIMQVRLRLARAKAAMREVDLDIKTGRYVAVDDLDETFVEVLMIAKSRLVAIPGRLAQRVSIETDPAVVKRLLEEEFAEIFKLMNMDLVTRE